MKLCLLAFAVLSASCAHHERQYNHAPDRSFAPESQFKFCEQQTTAAIEGNANGIVCERLFLTAPHLKLPNTEIRGRNFRGIGVLVGTTVSVTIEREFRNEQTYAFMTREKTFGLVIEPIKKTNFKTLPDIGEPGLKTAYTVYALSGEIEDDSQDRIKIHSIKPVVNVTGCALDGLFAGTWQAEISKRIPGGGFDSHDTVPIQITVDTLERFKSLEDDVKFNPVVDDKPTALPAGNVFSLVGRIDNLETGFKTRTKTFPSLSDLGERNPFLGATSNRIRLQRYSSMHVMGTMNLTMDWPPNSDSLGSNGMNEGSTVVINLENSIRGDLDTSLSKTNIAPHGLVPGFAVRNLRPVRLADYSLTCPTK